MIFLFLQIKDKKAPDLKDRGLVINFGDALLSHAVTHAVPSALKSLTSVFGMGTGGTSSLKSPKTVKCSFPIEQECSSAEQSKFKIMAKPHDRLVSVS